MNLWQSKIDDQTHLRVEILGRDVTLNEMALIKLCATFMVMALSSTGYVSACCRQIMTAALCELNNLKNASDRGLI